MIRIKPDFTGVDPLDARTVHDRIVEALLRVPAFEGEPLPFVVVLPPSIGSVLCILHYPDDPISLRSVAKLLRERYADRGYRYFETSENGDAAREADADERLLELLRPHPQASTVAQAPATAPRCSTSRPATSRHRSALLVASSQASPSPTLTQPSGIGCFRSDAFLLALTCVGVLRG
jgi:hypothetical protein